MAIGSLLSVGARKPRDDVDDSMHEDRSQLRR